MACGRCLTPVDFAGMDGLRRPAFILAPRTAMDVVTMRIAEKYTDSWIGPSRWFRAELMLGVALLRPCTRPIRLSVLRLSPPGESRGSRDGQLALLSISPAREKRAVIPTVSTLNRHCSAPATLCCYPHRLDLMAPPQSKQRGLSKPVFRSRGIELRGGVG